MAEPRLRVFVVDDHDLFRAGVRAAIGSEVDIIGEADDVDPAVELIRERNPEVVLLDVHLPGGGGHRVVKEVHRTHPQIRFLALSVSDSPKDVVAVLRAGASGYLTKTATAHQVVEALHLVAAGHAVFSPQLAGFVLEAFPAVDPASVDPDLDRLTPRQREVLRYIAKGYTYKETADALGVSPRTVETHVSEVLRKLQLTNRNELTRWAVDRGLG
ncbi:MAG: response regulator transcription factor [Acidimicrobiia bacterium]|jgi:DNA-binding NarL/FixJ family response regulator|nr:response regulator transcription factor [Acidimicrobiia bacterium]